MKTPSDLHFLVPSVRFELFSVLLVRDSNRRLTAERHHGNSHQITAIALKLCSRCAHGRGAHGDTPHVKHHLPHPLPGVSCRPVQRLQVRVQTELMTTEPVQPVRVTRPPAIRFLRCPRCWRPTPWHAGWSAPGAQTDSHRRRAPLLPALAGLLGHRRVVVHLLQAVNRRFALGQLLVLVGVLVAS
jgi:hypothetical protein